jgi:RNA polymerase-binding transcription factor DksA
MEADDLDRASELEEVQRQTAIRAAQAKLTSAPASFDGEHCVDCDEDVEQGRLAIGKYTCFACQTVRERRW